MFLPGSFRRPKSQKTREQEEAEDWPLYRKEYRFEMACSPIKIWVAKRHSDGSYAKQRMEREVSGRSEIWICFFDEFDFLRPQPKWYDAKQSIPNRYIFYGFRVSTQQFLEMLAFKRLNIKQLLMDWEEPTMHWHCFMPQPSSGAISPRSRSRRLTAMLQITRQREDH